jgi:hypothetical protein
MATRKRADSDPLPSEEQPRPGPLPTEGDKVREVGKRGHDDVRSPRKDTDQAGFNRQRETAPDTSPTHRSDKTDGTDDR